MYDGMTEYIKINKELKILYTVGFSICGFIGIGGVSLILLGILSN